MIPKKIKPSADPLDKGPVRMLFHLQAIRYVTVELTGKFEYSGMGAVWDVDMQSQEGNRSYPPWGELTNHES